MGGMTSFASTALQALSFANTIAKTVDGYQDKTGMRDFEKSKLELAGLAQKTALEKQQNIELQADRDRERQDRLRAAIAKQRAAYGASGVGSGAGSSQAYLLGLIDSAEDEKKFDSEAAQLKNRILDTNYANRQAVNMLERTQMKEKQKLQGVNALFQVVDG